MNSLDEMEGGIKGERWHLKSARLAFICSSLSSSLEGNVHDGVPRIFIDFLLFLLHFLIFVFILLNSFYQTYDGL